MTQTSCEHAGDLTIESGVLGAPPTSDGCAECLTVGSTWVTLRRCLACGGVACCDSSPNRHASRHGVEHDHPLVQSFEPGEDWVWCFADEVSLHVSGAENSPSHS